MYEEYKKEYKTCKYPVCGSAMNFFIFFVKLCDLCLLTSYSVLHTSSREMIKLCQIRKKNIEIKKVC